MNRRAVVALAAILLGGLAYVYWPSASAGPILYFHQPPDSEIPVTFAFEGPRYLVDVAITGDCIILTEVAGSQSPDDGPLFEGASSRTAVFLSEWEWVTSRDEAINAELGFRLGDGDQSLARLEPLEEGGATTDRAIPATCPPLAAVVLEACPARGPVPSRPTIQCAPVDELPPLDSD